MSETLEILNNREQDRKNCVLRGIQKLVVTGPEHMFDVGTESSTPQ